MKLYESHSLLSHNTFAVSATAVYYIEVESEGDAETLSRDEYFRTLPFIAIGGGSNLLFQGDFKGAVLHYSPNRVTVVSEDDERILLHVEGGKTWHELVMETAQKGLWGLENLALIPGECGAAAVQNIGAYGREIKDVLTAIHYVDLRTGEKKVLPAAEAGYSYRHSVFKEPKMAHALVTGIDIELKKTFSPELSYKGLSEKLGGPSRTSEARELGQREVTPDLTPLAVAEAVIEIRRQKLPDPEEYPNAGSFFMNPFVSREVFDRISSECPDVPHFVYEDGRIKIPAAWLIQTCGLKGYRDGKVGTYPRQPLVIVNYDGATAKEIADFSEFVQKSVRDKFGIDITPEVRFVRSGAQHSIQELES